MDLTSKKDILLLRNCVSLHLRDLTLEPYKLNNEKISEIEKYKLLLSYLNEQKIDEAQNILNNLDDKNFSNFEHISSRVLSTNVLETLKKHLQDLQIYSESDFEKIKTVFYKGNEDLLESENMDYNDCLKQLENLINRNNPKRMTSTQFIEFSESFKKLSKLFGISKFEEYFDTKNQKIVDMEISNDTPSIYKTLFSLKDEKNNLSDFIIEEPASSTKFISNYYQNLCYSYLEADKCSKMNEKQITTAFICEKMNDFNECFLKLKDMSKYKIEIFGNNMIRFTSETSIEPIPESIKGDDFEQEDDFNIEI